MLLFQSGCWINGFLKQDPIQVVRKTVSIGYRFMGKHEATEKIALEHRSLPPVFLKETFLNLLS